MMSLQKLTKLYVEQGMSLRAIGRENNTGHSVVRKLLLKAGITLRPFRKGERKDQKGHVEIFRPKHPRAKLNGYVHRAIIVWEEANGQPFPIDREPHHDNGIPDDDRPGNIIPLVHGEHTREHNRRRRQL